MQHKCDSLFSLISVPVLCGLLGLLAFGCVKQAGPVGTAREIGVSKLRSDLQTLVASPAVKEHEIPMTAWPESVRRFQPLAVQLHMEGVLIVTKKVGREQEGLLVMLDAKGDPGSGGSGASYESLGNGLFWCTEKIRDAYIPEERRTNR